MARTIRSTPPPAPRHRPQAEGEPELRVGPAARLLVGHLRRARSGGGWIPNPRLGALSIYLIAGTFHAFLGDAVANLESGPFVRGGLIGSLEDHVHFSFTTITTVGYGDLAPLSDIARTMSATEALLGQLYLVTVVAVVVANLGRGPGGRLAQTARREGKAGIEQP